MAIILWLHPHLADDVIEGYEAAAHRLCCLSVGYFAYDFVDMALYTFHKKSTKVRRLSLNTKASRLPTV